LKPSKGDHTQVIKALKMNDFIKNDNQSYNKRDDFYGLNPVNNPGKEKNIHLEDIGKLANMYDVAYYCDAQGMSFGEVFKLQENRSPGLVYGGLNHNEYLFLKRMRDMHKGIILEHNLLSYPTNPLIIFKLEELLKIKYTGWRGKFFKSLDIDDIPNWIVEHYEKQTNFKWSFSGSGVVLINEDVSVLVLETGKHLSEGMPVIKLNDDLATAIPDISVEQTYEGWFEVTYALDNSVKASFKLNVNSSGTELLSRFNLNSEFPALIENNQRGIFFYLTGDFSDRSSNSFGFYNAFYYPLSKYLLFRLHSNMQEQSVVSDQE
jgi:hypothetical protein